MGRIIFFGCSVTYGHGLPDCIISEVDPGNQHSNMGFPSILGNRLGLETVNRALPGSANVRILNRVLDFAFEPEDIVVLQWTFFNRNGLFSDNNEAHENILEIRPWMTQDIVRKFYELHSDYDLYHRSMFDIHHANIFLKNKVNKLVNIVISGSANDTLANQISVPNWFNIDLTYWTMLDITIDLANDNSHPGLKSQELIADLVERML